MSINDHELLQSSIKSNHELQEKVEAMVDKYLREKKLVAFENNSGQLDILEKHFQKNQLLVQVVNNINEIVTIQMDQIQEQVNEQISYQESQISKLKELMLRSLHSNSGDSTMKTQKETQVFNVLGQDFNSKEITDKSSKGIIKKLKEVEDSLLQRIQHTDNLLNILMDNQYNSLIQILNRMASKETIKDLKMNMQPPSEHKAPQNDLQIKNLTNLLDKKIDDKIKGLEMYIEEELNKQRDNVKEKMMYYWTVLNDVSDKQEKLRKEFNDKNLPKGGIFGKLGQLAQ